MISHNLKLIIRRMVQEKGFSVINLFGLVIGITSFLVLFLYVANEKSFDKHIPDHRDIYRVTTIPFGGEEIPWARSLGLMLPASATFPEIEEATQFAHSPMGTIKIGKQSFQFNDIMSVDESFFKIFSVKTVTGNYNEISKPNVVFISEDIAERYFKNENPIGKTIDIEELQYDQKLGVYEIRGIIKNAHPKTHFRYDMLLSQKGALQNHHKSIAESKVLWVYNYVKLKKNTNPALVAKKYGTYFDASKLKQTLGPTAYHINLMPLTDIHLKSNYRYELKESSSKINIGLFVIISFVVLLISLLNFINLTISKIIKRSKEFGLRKSIGANIQQLTYQILVEVFLFCSVSIIISLVLIEIIKQPLNHFFEVDFKIYYSEPIVFLSIIGVIVVSMGLTGLFVGVYLFGKASTIDILSSRNNYSGSFLLKSLLVIQITIVIILLSGTFLVNKQTHFMMNKPLGFDKENVLVITLKDFSKDPVVFANEFKKQSQVISVGFTNSYFGYPTQTNPLEGLGIDGNFELVRCDYDYLKTMNIELIENWITPTSENKFGLVINNHLYKRLIEKHGSIESFNTFQKNQEFAPNLSQVKIVGVAKDFNYSSAHIAVGDFAFLLSNPKSNLRYIHIRLNKGDVRRAVKEVEKLWNTHYSGQTMNYFFIDEEITRQYKAETILSRILFTFSMLGILISIIGISALALFISQQRTKEIGIRKVNGARILEVMVMLNRDFMKWVAIAFIVATPIAYFAMHKWLENFAYKTSLSWWIFALAGLLALGIALLTVSWQSWKAATRNPVEALRYE